MLRAAWFHARNRAAGLPSPCPARDTGTMLSPLATGVCTGLGVAAGAGLAAGGYAYAALWPGSRLFGHALVAPRRPGELALTFDDGPNPTATSRLLDLLARHRVQATFFLLGSRAQALPDLVRRMLGEGHLVGSHSWNHLNLAYTAAAPLRAEIVRGKQAIEAITCAPVRFFRPPFGARRPLALRVARDLGMTPVLWNALTSDWKEPLAERIAARLQRKIDRLQRRGFAANIVLHDGGHLDPAANRAPSVAAAGRLIARYASTHSFVRLDAWEACAS